MTDPFQGFPGRECPEVIYDSLSSGTILELYSLSMATQVSSSRVHSEVLNVYPLALHVDI